MGSLISQARHNAAQPVALAAPPSRQFLSFALGSETFAIPIENIREIIEFSGLTEVPLMPGFLRGVINVRGAVVPVIDLAVRFGRGVTAVTRRTCIVILEVEQDDQLLALGIMVDTVNEVLAVEQEQMETRPSFGAKVHAEFIEGMIRQGERFVIALNIQQVLAAEELAALGGVSEDAVPVTPAQAGTAPTL